MYYGFDIGGTKTAFAVYDERLALCDETRFTTPSQDYQALLQQMQALVSQADQRFATQGRVGVGFPGILHHQDQSIVAANLPAIHGRHLADDLAEYLARPVKIDNDANCFLWSEVQQGAAHGARSALGVTIGTGIGGALYLAGSLIQGRNGLAGEIGHYPLPATMLMKYPDLPLPRCGCGRFVCFETYASGRGLTRLYQHYFERTFTGAQIIEQWAQGQEKARYIVDIWLEILAAGLACAVSVVDPQVVVLGGGLSQVAALYEQLPSRLVGHLLPGVAVPLIKPAIFGGGGGVRGAALLSL